MPRPTPATARTILAISDARMRLRARLAADGEICPLDTEALLLLDAASREAHVADLNRRQRYAIEDHGAISPWLDREANEIERAFAHVTDRQAA